MDQPIADQQRVGPREGEVALAPSCARAEASQKRAVTYTSPVVARGAEMRARRRVRSVVAVLTPTTSATGGSGLRLVPNRAIRLHHVGRP